MKVKSIASFFQKAGSSSRATPADDEDEDLVEVPSKLKKGGSKKPKAKEQDRLNVSIGNSEDSDGEDPLPKSIRKKHEQNKAKGSKSRKPLAISDDESDGEDPLPKSSRNKKSEKDTSEKKRKARVLSESDEDDFKPQKKTLVDKPAAKLAKVEKPVEKKKKELKPVNPADFFSNAPIKREVKKEREKPASSKTNCTSPGKSKDEESAKSSPSKNGKSSSSTPPKSKAHNGEREESPHRPPSSLIEPKKLRMSSRTPEKKQPPASTSSKHSPDSKAEKKSKESPVKIKQEPTFKAPTPVTKERSKPKRPVVEEDEEEEDFNPKMKVKAASSSAASKSKGNQAKSSSASKRDKTPAKDSGTDDEAPKSATTPKQRENYMKFLAKMSMKPKNLGSKEIPVGAPDCLQGLTFVVSGVLDSLERDDCKDLVMKYGARLTSAVSGKTSYLIVGDEPGESKLKKAEQLKVPQITEDGLLDMIRKSNPEGNSNTQDSGLPFSEGMAGMDSEQFKTEDEETSYDADKSLFETPVATKRESRSSPRKPEPSKLAKQESPKKRSPEKKIKVEEEPAPKVAKKEKEETKASSSSAPLSVPASSSSVLTGQAGLMWVDKYKPKALKNVVGQGVTTSNANKLLRWLQNWFKYHGSSQDKPKASWPGLKDPEGKTFKAALLSGPPGIGKTTTAHLVVKEVGYDYFELNASDTRNKRGLHENVADALSSKTLAFGRTDGTKARYHVLIMDEVDGMSGNEDRGGVQELIGLIKSSRVPIICICNDRNHQKIRSLANYCFDLRFNKPSFEQLKAFIMSICFKEKIKLPMEKVQQLIISTDNDVRQILHQLELFKEGKSEQAFNPRKDLKFGPWDVVRKIFLKSEHAKMSIHDKAGLFFQDYSLGPLFVQENYLRWIPAAAGGNRYKHMDIIGKTAASIADGDMVESVIRRNQNWGLLPVQAVFASYLPGEYMSANSMGGVEFPQWLGKNSNKNKRHRLLQSLHSHLQLHVSGSLEALNMDYLPYLRRTLTKPLVEGDHESAAKIMEDYTLLRDDVESITDLSVWPGTRDPMERVESKVKAAFTRQVNKEILPYSSAKPTKAKGRGGGTQEDDLEALMDGEEGGAVEEEEEEESIEKDAMVKMKTRKAAASKSKPAAPSSSKSTKRKKKDDSDSDDDDDFPTSSKNAKSSKSKQPSKSRKGK